MSDPLIEAISKILRVTTWYPMRGYRGMWTVGVVKAIMSAPRRMLSLLLTKRNIITVARDTRRSEKPPGRKELTDSIAIVKNSLSARIQVDCDKFRVILTQIGTQMIQNSSECSRRLLMLL
jgi:hypothetical protein